MKKTIQDKIGILLHHFTNNKFKAKFNGGRAIILMSGPSNENDTYSTCDLAVTSNLTNPHDFTKRITSKEYIHCFSDPDIITNEEKEKIFLDILRFARERDNYTLLVPVTYLKFKVIRANFFSESINFYNTNNSFKNKAGLTINKTSFPNMNTILLDCALPFSSYIGINEVFVSGFDAHYGVGKKSYSSSNYEYNDKEKPVDNWKDIVKVNAVIMSKILKEINGTKINYSEKSGFGKYLNEKFDNNW
ncbi:hypothetical protein K5N30_003098 [Vibrio parahaemolyticus]|nr:hypothetical protein [Vibrio parahaemolyticus]